MRSALLVAVAAIALAVVFGREAAGYPVEAQRLPYLLSWLVGGLAVLVLVDEAFKWRRRRRIARGQLTVGAEAVVEPMPAVVWSALIPFGLAIAAYVWLIPFAGYLLTTFVFLGGALLVSRTVRPVTALATAAGLTGAIWIIFVWLLRLPIPLLPQV